MFKKCRVCDNWKLFDEFHKSSSNKDGLDNRCKCCKKLIAQQSREGDYFYQYLITKRSECKRKGIRCDLTADYLESIWTGRCPIFDIEISRASKGRGSHHSAHLDRLDPNGGYVEGNVAWISGRANRIKYDATANELRKIADWMEGATTIPKGSTLEA